MGEGQAWGPGSHLPRMYEMVSSVLLPPIPSLVSGFLSVCPPLGGEGCTNLHCGVGAGFKTVGRPEICPTWPWGKSSEA